MSTNATFQRYAVGFLRERPSTHAAIEHIGGDFVAWLVANAPDLGESAAADVAVWEATVAPDPRSVPFSAAGRIDVDRCHLTVGAHVRTVPSGPCWMALWRDGASLRRAALDGHERDALERAREGISFVQLCEGLTIAGGDADGVFAILSRWRRTAVRRCTPLGRPRRGATGAERVVAAAASRFARAMLAAGLLEAPRAAAEPALDSREVLGHSDDIRITSAAIRLTAYEQRGRGYQSRAGLVTGPGSERVTVFEPQLEVIASQGERLTHRLWIPIDIVTAASPNAIDRGADVVSQASRQNEAATLDWSTRFRWTPDVALSFRGGLHVEEIWRSWHAGLAVDHAFAERNTVVSASLLSVFDWFDGYLLTGRKDGLRRRGSNTVSVAVTQVLSRTTLAEVSYGLTLQSGVLGNGWNVVPLAQAGVLEEAVPTRRLRHATVGRLVQGLPWNGALKGYYRLYTDDWSVASHTWEAQVHQRIAPGLDVAVGARLHRQSDVAFFTTRGRRRGPAHGRQRPASADLALLARACVARVPRERLGSHRHVFLFRTLRPHQRPRGKCLHMAHRFFLLMLLVSSCAPAETPRPTDVHHLPLRTLGGDRTDLATLAGDRAVVVALFGSWCEGCRRETPALARLAASGRASRDFVVVGVAIGEERDRVEAFAGTHSVRYPLLLDAEGAFARLGRRQVPTTFVLARDGRVVHEGAALDEEALAALARTLR